MPRSWRVIEGPTPVDRPGEDAAIWKWGLERDDRKASILVKVSRTAMGTRREDLPADTRKAIETKGKSALDEYLDAEDPPQVVEFSTKGRGIPHPPG